MPTVSTAALGSRYIRWVCTKKLATPTASGSSFQSPAASDSPANMRKVKGSRGAYEFQISLRIDLSSEAAMTATQIAVATMSGVPPRRRASTTQPARDAAFTAPITTTIASGPIRAGTAHSQ